MERSGPRMPGGARYPDPSRRMGSLRGVVCQQRVRCRLPFFMWMTSRPQKGASPHGPSGWGFVGAGGAGDGAAGDGGTGEAGVSGVAGGGEAGGGGVASVVGGDSAGGGACSGDDEFEGSSPAGVGAFATTTPWDVTAYTSHQSRTRPLGPPQRSKRWSTTTKYKPGVAPAKTETSKPCSGLEHPANRFGNGLVLTTSRRAPAAASAALASMGATTVLAECSSGHVTSPFQAAAGVAQPCSTANSPVSVSALLISRT